MCKVIDESSLVFAGRQVSLDIDGEIMRVGVRQLYSEHALNRRIMPQLCILIYIRGFQNLHSAWCIQLHYG